MSQNPPSLDQISYFIHIPATKYELLHTSNISLVSCTVLNLIFVSSCKDHRMSIPFISTILLPDPELDKWQKMDSWIDG